MQNPTALGIGAVIELLHRILIAVVHNWFFIILLRQNAVRRVSVQTVQRGIAPVLMSLVEMRVERREAFVQPQMAPVFASDVIAEPLMSQFMGIETA